MNRYTQYFIAVVLLVIAYYYCIHLTQIFAKSSDGIKSAFVRMHEMCFVECENACITSKLRGDNYYIGVMNAQKKEKLGRCLLTFWSMTHFVLYGVIGFVCPDIFWETFAIGVGFEVYEQHEYGCQDWTDIIYNTGGYLAGRWLRRKLN